MQWRDFLSDYQRMINGALKQYIMKANWKTIGIAVGSAALLYYPALKLYQFLSKKMQGMTKNDKAGENNHHVVKAFTPAYRGVHKPHHRHS